MYAFYNLFYEHNWQLQNVLHFLDSPSRFIEIPLKYVRPARIFCPYLGHEYYQILQEYLQPVVIKNMISTL